MPYVVDSEPPQERYPRRENYRGRVLSAHFLLFVGIAVILFMGFMQFLDEMLTHVFHEGWIHLHSALQIGCWIVLIPCAVAVIWKSGKECVETLTNVAHQIMGLLKTRAHTKLITAKTKLISDAQLSGDNFKMTWHPDGTPASIEVIRGSVLIEQAQAQYSGRASQVAGGNQKQIAEKATKVVPEPAIVPPEEFPEKFDLMEVFKRSTITPQNVFLGKMNRGVPLWVDATKELCHGVFAAVTGRGKTVIERGIEAQLLTCGVEVLHLDLKFTLIDENGLDYRPIAKRLLGQQDLVIGNEQVPHLVTDIDQIYRVLNWLANAEVPRRLKMYHAGNHSYPVLYVFLEELLYLMNKKPDVSDFIEDIIVVGRSLGIKLFTAAQNFQSQNTNISGGMSENFETAYYCGGDDFSGAKVLDVSQKELKAYLAQYQLNLGGGLTLVRNNTVAPRASLTRIGMASNEAVYYLLGKADDFQWNGTLLAPGGTPDTKRVYSTSRVVPATLSGTPQNGQNSPLNSFSERNTGPLKNATEPREDSAASGAEEMPEDAEEVQELEPGDLQMNEDQIAMFTFHYERGNSIKKSLAMTPHATQRGKGLGRRYFRHASNIVKLQQLKRGANS